MNAYVKQTAKFLLPERFFATIQSIRSRNYQQRLNREWGVQKATAEIVRLYGVTVLDGPFCGMKYPKSSLLSRNGIPPLFGTYELELHSVIEEVTTKKYDTIIDVGSAEGYYAVGFALKTNALIYAFDCEPRERSYLRQMARENGVADRVCVRSWCSRRTLKGLATGRCFVMSDCEGYEVHLFSDDVVSALKNCDLLIELHENPPGADVRRIMLERFRRSHNARLIQLDSTKISDAVPDKWRLLAREIRPAGQQWIYVTHRS